MQKLLLVEDDPNLNFTILTALEAQGYTVDAVSTTGEAMERLGDNAYPVVLTDIYIDERTGLDVLDAAKRKDPRCAVILMTGRGTVETVMAATKGGAFEYIAKPFELDTLFDALTRAEAARNDTEAEAEEEELPESVMIGSSAAMVEIYKKVVRVAPTDATVVIEGETGTGKELVARMIHRFSLRAKQPFVPVDCAAIAPSLLESELFGAMRGAFTGADRDRVGVFEAANRGTVFLDEIGEIDKSFQANLLRFLQEHEIRPLGASRAKEVDVRVICATNRDLQRMVDEGKFREDLWYRLNTVRIVMPPLRERRDDIPLLARFYVNKYNGDVPSRGQADGFGRTGAAGLHLAGQRAAVAARDRTPHHSGRTGSTGIRSSKHSPRWNRATSPWIPWRMCRRTRSAKCWPPRAAIRARPPRSWASNARRCIASWNV